MKKSTVFISCGQRNDRERKFGEKLISYFQTKGFETYFAEHIHSSKPLLQSILEALKESEYFVVWNPYRVKTGDVGSLFVQQEIAVAASLGLPSLYFFDKGVGKTTGMSGALHLNGIEISDVLNLESQLDKLTQTWDSTSKNQLFLDFGNEHKEFRVVNEPNQPLSTWYHITVENGNSFKHAKNCRAYVEKLIHDDDGKDLTSEYKQELIWAGTGLGEVSITSKSRRDIDAIWTRQDSRKWQFQSVQTSTGYTYPILPGGKYSFTYLVVSDNMPDARLNVKLDLENNQAKVIEQKQL